MRQHARHLGRETGDGRASLARRLERRLRLALGRVARGPGGSSAYSMHRVLFFLRAVQRSATVPHIDGAVPATEDQAMTLDPTHEGIYLAEAALREIARETGIGDRVWGARVALHELGDWQRGVIPADLWPAVLDAAESQLRGILAR